MKFSLQIFSSQSRELLADLLRSNAFQNLNFLIFHFISGIIIRFLGEANTEWSDTRRVTNSEGRDEEETVTYKGHEEYFQIQYYLLGGKNSNLIITFIINS